MNDLLFMKKKIKRKGEKKSEALGLFEWKSPAHFFLSVCSSSEWIWEIKDVMIIIIIKSTFDTFFNHISRRQFFYGRTEKTVWNWSLSASWRTRVWAVMNWYCVSVADFFRRRTKRVNYKIVLLVSRNKTICSICFKN